MQIQLYSDGVRVRGFEMYRVRAFCSGILVHTEVSWSPGGARAAMRGWLIRSSHKHFAH